MLGFRRLIHIMLPISPVLLIILSFTAIVTGLRGEWERVPQAGDAARSRILVTAGGIRFQSFGAALPAAGPIPPNPIYEGEGWVFPIGPICVNKGSCHNASISAALYETEIGLHQLWWVALAGTFMWMRRHLHLRLDEGFSANQLRAYGRRLLWPTLICASVLSLFAISFAWARLSASIDVCQLGRMNLSIRQGDWCVQLTDTTPFAFNELMGHVGHRYRVPFINPVSTVSYGGSMGFPGRPGQRFTLIAISPGKMTLISLLLVIPIVIAWVKYIPIRRHMQSNSCAGCGYDLRATPQRCPECGLATDATTDG